MRWFSIFKGMKWCKAPWRHRRSGLKKLWGLSVGSSLATEEAKKRAKILDFFDKYGLDATKEAFGVSRSTIYL